LRGRIVSTVTSLECQYDVFACSPAARRSINRTGNLGPQRGWFAVRRSVRGEGAERVSARAGRRSPMTEGSEQIWQDLSVMADAFADLGRRLLSASRQLHAPGSPPSDTLVDDINALRQGFAAMRERTCRLAVAVGVAV